jgi:spermidine/putrescine transport system permease protein
MKARSLPSHIPFSFGIPAILWQILFFYLPLALIIATSAMAFSRGETLAWKGLFLFTYLKIIGNSLVLALGNALACLCIAYPLAYLLVFKVKRWKNFLLFLFIVPFWTNFLLHVYSWIFILDKHGLFNTILQTIGIIHDPLHFLYTPFAIYLMMIYTYFPFMVMPIHSALEHIDPHLIEASFVLEATWWQTFRKVLLPLTKKGIFAGFFLVYIPSFGEFAIPEFMGGGKYLFVGNVIADCIIGGGARAFGMTFTLFACSILLISVGLLYWGLEKILR